jgi:hypothetical protein
MTIQDKRQTITPIAAGVAGAIVGVLGGATAMAMRDENTRKKVTKKMSDLKDQAVSKWKDMQTSEKLSKKSQEGDDKKNTKKV